MLIDTHAHLNSEEYDRDLEETVARAMAAGVEAIINVGSGLDSSQWAVKLATRPGFYAVVGIHPHNASALAKIADGVEKLADNPGVVAIGEIGLDYYRNLSSPEAQRECFAYFINVARRRRLPIVIHDRDAHKDVLDILIAEKAADVGGVFHCFTGDWATAQKALDLGFYISIAGPVTYKGNLRLQEVARQVPLDRILVETDCPYLTPEPYRGKRNEPGLVRHTAVKVAELRGIPVEDLIAATGRNAGLAFGLDKGWRLSSANRH